MHTLWTILAVGAGGAAGALARWGLSLAIVRHVAPGNAHVPTIVVNILGCAAIGFCYVWLTGRAEEQSGAHAMLKPLLMTGFFGAMTTFSTYSLESVLLLEEHRYGAVAINTLGSVALGLVGVVLGMSVAGRVFD